MKIIAYIFFCILSGKLYCQTSEDCTTSTDTLFNTFMKSVLNNNIIYGSEVDCAFMDSEFYNRYSRMINEEVTLHKIYSENVLKYYAFDIVNANIRMECAVIVYKLNTPNCDYYIKKDCFKTGYFITEMPQYYDLYIEGGCMFILTANKPPDHPYYMILREEFAKMRKTFLLNK